MPKISVLFPTYNTKEEYLREAMESVLNQTFSDFEFIIVDDCSPDPNVEKVVKSYTDPRIRFYRNERNLGISATRNKLIDLASGEYLAVMDGEVTVECRGEQHVVGKSQVFRFETDQMHIYRNATNEKVSFMCFFVVMR